MRDLPLEDLPFLREDLRVARLHQLQRGQRRSQRVPQLVSQHRQELILRPAGLLGLGARGVGALDLRVALAGALLEQRRRGRERLLQPARFHDMSAGLLDRPAFGHRFSGGRGYGQNPPARRRDTNSTAARPEIISSRPPPRVAVIETRSGASRTERGTTITDVQPEALRFVAA